MWSIPASGRCTCFVHWFSFHCLQKMGGHGFSDSMSTVLFLVKYIYFYIYLMDLVKFAMDAYGPQRMNSFFFFFWWWIWSLPDFYSSDSVRVIWWLKFRSKFLSHPCLCHGCPSHFCQCYITEIQIDQSTFVHPLGLNDELIRFLFVRGQSYHDLIYVHSICPQMSVCM